MANKKTNRLSVGELEVLDLLWQTGPVSLSEAHENWDGAIGYTTIQTRLNRLVIKGVVKKSKDRPTHYSAAISRDQVSRQDLKILVERVNEGEFIPLVAHLVDGRKLSKVEIDQLKKIIAEAETNASSSKKKRRDQ